MRLFAAFTLFLMAGIGPAMAHKSASVPLFDRHGVSGQWGVTAQPAAISGTKRERRAKRHQTKPKGRHIAVASRTEATILPHPVGCPARSFCGCAAALDVFGKHVRDLWLAANWFKFPKAEPAPGMVAVRRHHVFVIREVRGPGLVLAYDGNSGGHKTRLHLRSLAGFSVRNPRGSQWAAAI